MTSEKIKIVSVNRKARHDFHVVEELEAGMVLQGTEVKSLRQGKANLKDAYGRFNKKGELYVYQMHISPYTFAHYDNHDPERPRKLLLHKSELKRLYGKSREKGYTLVPLKIYFKNGKAKLAIGLARGKREYDKREAIKERDIKRETSRAIKDYK